MNDQTYTSGELLHWLWHGYLKRHTPAMLLAVFFMAIEGATLGALARLMEPMFDQVFVAGDSGALIWVGLFLAAIFTMRALAGVGQKVVLTRVAQKTSASNA